MMSVLPREDLGGNSVHRFMGSSLGSVAIRSRLEICLGRSLPGSASLSSCTTRSRMEGIEKGAKLAPSLWDFLLPVPHGSVLLRDQFVAYLL